MSLNVNYEMIEYGVRIIQKAIEENKKLDFSEIFNSGTIDIRNRKVLGDFVSNNTDLKVELESIKNIIGNYLSRTEKKRPLNILLSASPGSGKSFLLRQFKGIFEKEDFKIEYKEFNLSTLISKVEIFQIFQFIQDCNEAKITPIVFIDEVDTIINGEYVFPLLISAMSDGESKYIKHSFECRHAIMAFAGSGLFEQKSSNKSNIAISIPNNLLSRIQQFFIELFY